MDDLTRRLFRLDLTALARRWKTKFELIQWMELWLCEASVDFVPNSPMINFTTSILMLN